MAARKKKSVSLKSEVLGRIKRADASARAASVRKAKSLTPVRAAKKSTRKSAVVGKNTAALLREQKRRAAGKTPRKLGR